MIDLLDYLRGDGRLYELVNNWGTYEIVQTQTEANNVFYHVKNSQWEELWADDVFIYRGTDTSPGNGELYMLSENNHYGSAWVPRWFEVGQTFQRNGDGDLAAQRATARRFRASRRRVAVTYMRLERVYTTADVSERDSTGGRGGTARLSWTTADNRRASPWEKYFYAKGFGLVAFQDMYGGFHSWIAQKFTPETMPQRVRETIPWLVPLQKRYYLPRAAGDDGRRLSYRQPDDPGDCVNVRAYPNLTAKTWATCRKARR